VLADKHEELKPEKSDKAAECSDECTSKENKSGSNVCSDEKVCTEGVCNRTDRAIDNTKGTSGLLNDAASNENKGTCDLNELERWVSADFSGSKSGEFVRKESEGTLEHPLMQDPVLDRLLEQKHKPLDCEEKTAA